MDKLIPSHRRGDSEVTVWLTEPLWERDPSTEEMFQSNRHVARAEQVIQDCGSTRVVNSDGVIMLEFPTEYVDRCTWTVTTSPPRSATEKIEHPPDGIGLPIRTKAWREAISRESPRAYEPWTVEEDDELRTEIERGTSRKAIAKSHQRRLGAITSRISKLGLD